MKRRDFIWKAGAGLAGLATAGCAGPKLNKLDIFTPKRSLENFLTTYTPLVEDAYNNKKEPSQFLYNSMLSDAQEISLDYSRNEGEKLKYSTAASLASVSQKGDIDGNGKVDIFDLLKLLKVLGGEQPTPASDIDNNGIVNIFDLLDLLRILSGTYGKTIYKGSLADLFSNSPIQEADVELLDSNGNVLSMQKAKNGNYNISLESSNDLRRLRFNANNYFSHTSSEISANESRTMNLGLVPSSFNMDLFDKTVRSGNNQPDATTRWMTVPKFYIVNGPIAGYNIFETPTETMINELVDIINKDLKTFTNNFVNNPLIKIGNDPLGEGAGKEIITNPYGTIINTNNGWVTIHYTLDPKMGWAGARSVITNPDYSVNKAYITIRGPPVNQTNRRMGMHELTAVMGYLRNNDEIDSVLNTTVEKADNYSDFDLKLGKFLYSRPAGNRTKDINP